MALSLLFTLATIIPVAVIIQ